MKASGRCVVAIENKSGDFWQIALSDYQQDLIIQFLEEIHEGKIKVIRNKLPISLPTKSTNI